MSRRVRAVALLAAVTALTWCSTGCSTEAVEPDARPGGTPITTAAATLTPSADPSATPTGGTPLAPSGSGGAPGTAEPGPTFTQPFLPPGEHSVVDLPTELPIDPPRGASPDERAVLAAAGRFMASWDSILFGAGEERSGILRTAADPQLGRLLNHLAESHSKRRVVVGRPTELELLDVSVRGDTAEVDLCTIMRDWVQYTGGTPQPQPEVERLALTLSRADGQWRATDTAHRDATRCE